MQFPHLADTTFPNLETANVYQFQNTFDYTRWNEKTRIKLCNVLWNSDCRDVVKWDGNDARDSFFDELQDIYEIELETAARMLPNGMVKVPIPFDVASRYNYLFLDMPLAANSNSIIDYETTEGITRWYFFVNDVEYNSPNSTTLTLTPDVWTIYQNDIDIRYMLLERGHAPVAYSDVDAYLENPMENNKLLLAPDVNFDNAGISRNVEYVPIGNGMKYVCIASTCSAFDIDKLGSVESSEDYTYEGSIEFADTSDAWRGYQLEVSGFTNGNGYDYSNAQTVSTVAHAHGSRLATNLEIYAIDASACYIDSGLQGSFFHDVELYCPQFLNTVKACFVVDETMLTLSDELYDIAGHKVHTVTPRHNTYIDRKFVKADFDYPDEYANFAKLYTSPYSMLEVTDNDGTVFEIRIEETSQIKVEGFSALSFPYVNYRVWLDCVGGQGKTSYVWRDLSAQSLGRSMPKSDWFQYCFNWEIPCYALYMNASVDWMLKNFNRAIKQGIDNATVGYQNTMRNANTAYNNAVAAQNAANTNAKNAADVALANSLRSNQAANDNAYNSAAAIEGNANRSALDSFNDSRDSADVAKTNAENSADVVKTNGDASLDASYQVIDDTCTTNSAKLALNQTANLSTHNENAAVNNALLGHSNTMDDIAARNLNNLQASTTTASEIKTSQIAESQIDCGYKSAGTSGATGGAMMGLSIGGAAAGAITAAETGAFAGTAVAPGLGSVVGAGIGLIAGGIAGYFWQGGLNEVAVTNSKTATINANQAVTNAQIDYNTNMHLSNVSENGYKQDLVNDDDLFKVRLNNQLMDDILAAENARSRANGVLQRDTGKQMNANSHTTAYTNAQNSHDLVDTITQRDYDTAIANNARTRQTSEDNADTTKGAADQNATDTNAVSKANSDRTTQIANQNSLYTRNTSMLNAKADIRNARKAIQRTYYDARNSEPRQLGKYSGSMAPDYYENRGVQVKVKTQSDSAIAMTGDIFTRYGYMLNQIWNVHETGLNLMKHFTYWKATEIWVDDRRSSNNSVQDFVQGMFLNGVTVWNSPTEIGRIDVYDNFNDE